MMNMPLTKEEIMAGTQFIDRMAQTLRERGPIWVEMSQEDYDYNINLFGENAYVPAPGTKIFIN